MNRHHISLNMSDFLRWLGLGGGEEEEEKGGGCGCGSKSRTSSSARPSQSGGVQLPDLPAGQHLRPPFVVFFWSERCPHCHSMMPALNEAVRALKQKENQFAHRQILPIYASEAQTTPRSLLNSIAGYPTLRFYSSPTKYEDFSGRRDARSIYTWLEGKLKEVTQSSHGYGRNPDDDHIGRGVSSRYNSLYRF